MTTLPLLTACSPDDEPLVHNTKTPVPVPEQPDDGGDENEEGNNGNNGGTSNRNIAVIVGNTSFTATLEDNETARAFTALLPINIDMTEMNGNEKYYYLPQHLPVDRYTPGTIHKGDLMIYGSNCLVLFYKSFSSGYSYTHLGRIDNPDKLAEAVGRGNITVRFETTPIK